MCATDCFNCITFIYLFARHTSFPFVHSTNSFLHFMQARRASSKRSLYILMKNSFSHASKFQLLVSYTNDSGKWLIMSIITRSKKEKVLRYKFFSFSTVFFASFLCTHSLVCFQKSSI